ncbi:MAG: Mrp/NBP35 family ATP-binding protein [Novosphingobium sp.]
MTGQVGPKDEVPDGTIDPEENKEALLASLPPAARQRILSLRLADGIASLVLDVADVPAAARDRLEAEVKAAISGQPGVRETRVAMVADRARPRLLAVGSGKGGVGKSTLAANLAVALARAGRRVGLVDADIHGPSQPRILGSEGERPVARDKKLVPVPGRWGVPLLSMGHLAEPGQAIAWRGPMAGNALGQLIDAHWGNAELLVVDLPPGTGDVLLTMVQRFKPAGAVIVSTPQDLALIDATRAIALFEKAGVPVIGLVENMAGYACPHCGEISDPFGSGGAEAAARERGLPFLGRIPLQLGIRQQSDAGVPVAAGDGEEGRAFADIAARVAAWLDGAVAGR